MSRARAADTRASCPTYAGDKTFGVRLPRDLERFLTLACGKPLGTFVPRLPNRGPSFAALVDGASRSNTRRAHLLALLAGGVPFGTTRGGGIFVCMLGEPGSPARGVIVLVDSAMQHAPEVVHPSTSTFAFECALDQSLKHGAPLEQIEQARLRIPAPGVAQRESVRGAFERARSILALLVDDEPDAMHAATRLLPRPLNVPPPEPAAAARGRKSGSERTSALALGPIVEAFFRHDDKEFDALADLHDTSGDALVREAVKVFTKAQKALASRSKRLVALRERRARVRAARPPSPRTWASSLERLELTRHVIDAIDRASIGPDAAANGARRAEALLALAEFGDRDLAPVLMGRAVRGDVDAVDMLAALGHREAVPLLVGLLGAERDRQPATRTLEASIVRALGVLGDARVGGTLRALLVASPMTNWREGIARAEVVFELTHALGLIGDVEAGPVLLEVLDGQSQEYRAVVPTAAWALGRIRHGQAFTTLERTLSSPKNVATCEAVWAVGELARAHPSIRRAANELLENLQGLDPGCELVRLTALTKFDAQRGRGPSVERLGQALERALWEPAFRREETAKRKIWALRSFLDLAPGREAPRGVDRERFASLLKILDHEPVRYFLTFDDLRVRREARAAFAAWNLPVPETRRYYAFLLDDMERSGGLEALHDALRDPLGIFRHNVAAHLSKKGDPSSVRPLAEATARLFAEPPTSTYEYDDAPGHLVAFVQALAQFNRPEGNAVLIEGLRHGHHHVRAVVAENAPDDERFIPELMAMLGDTRSFIRSRAERSLHALGVHRAGSDLPPRRVEG